MNIKFDTLDLYKAPNGWECKIMKDLKLLYEKMVPALAAYYTVAQYNGSVFKIDNNCVTFTYVGLPQYDLGV